MNIALDRLKRLPFSTILAARNYGMDNISAPANAGPGSKLCMAVLRGDNIEVQELLNCDAPINYQDAPDGWTPLIYSIYYDNPRTTEMLLKSNADPDLPDFYDRTPLMFAAIKNNVNLIIELLRRGASIDAIDYRGKSALDFAGEYRNADAANLLEKIAGKLRRR